MSQPVVTVFGSGVIPTDDPEYQKAQVLGAALAKAGCLVCSGGYQGIMEAVSRGAKENGGEVLGVTLESTKGKPNPWLTREEKVDRWEARLFRLIELGDVFVVCDGGTGTLVEFMTVWEMASKGFSEKPFIVMGQFMKGLTDFLKTQPLVRTNALLKVADTPEEAALMIQDYCKTLSPRLK